MKVNVITRHFPANYGSLLQAIATQKIIESLGFECEIIDYIPKAETGARIAFTQLKGKKSWNNNILKKVLYVMGREPENLIMYHKFESMRKDYLYMTNRCADAHELNALFSDKNEIFMTGSDQVWGPTSTGLYDPAYFLSFIPDGKKKVAFAASFGKTDFTNEIITEYNKYLKKYDKIAVRENSAVKLVNEMGLQAEQVLDPTLLLTAEEWQKYITDVKHNDYVLVYQIHNNPSLDQYAVKFAEKAGLPLIRVSAMLHQVTRGGKFVWLPKIDKFLSLIKNAKYMVTDSFHGTAFAINFNIQFVDILPDTGTSGRNQSILELTGLKNRIVTDLTNFKFIYEEIDFSNVNKIIAEQRMNSLNVLKNMLIG